MEAGRTFHSRTSALSGSFPSAACPAGRFRSWQLARDDCGEIAVEVQVTEVPA
jgi:hypothetical protein